MSNLVATKENTVAPVRTRSRAWSVVLWVLQAGLAFQFASAGFVKLTGAAPMVEMFDAIGAGQWLRVLVGALEIAGAIGLLVPVLCGLAAVGIACLMVGATITNVFVLGMDTTITIVFLLVAVVIAAGRWSKVTAVVRRFRS